MVLARWLGKHQDVSLVVLELGKDPELWRKHEIRGTPSIRLERTSGAGAIFIEGLAREPKLDAAYQALQRPTHKDTKKE